MAKAQTEEQGEPIEEILAEANAKALAKKDQSSPSPAPTESELAMLADLPPDLRDLCRRICDARWGEIAGMDDKRIAAAMMLRYAHEGLTSKSSRDWMAGCDKWLARQLGNPVTPIAAKVESHDRVDVTIRLV